MPADSPTTSRRWRRRTAEAGAWMLGLTLSISAVFGMHSLAAQPFTATLDDPLALPRELTSRGQDPNVPLPPVGAVDAPAASSTGDAAADAVLAVPGASMRGRSATTTTVAPANLVNQSGPAVTTTPPVPTTTPPTATVTPVAPPTASPATNPNPAPNNDDRPVAVPDTGPAPTAAPAAPSGTNAAVNTTVTSLVNRLLGNSNSGRSNNNSGQGQ